jgi:hypothetical protein
MGMVSSWFFADKKTAAERSLKRMDLIPAFELQSSLMVSNVSSFGRQLEFGRLFQCKA